MKFERKWSTNLSFSLWFSKNERKGEESCVLAMQLVEDDTIKVGSCNDTCKVKIHLSVDQVSLMWCLIKLVKLD